ncbi:hypothetical protein IFM89_015626 [Coptis chinensis]|uniref:BRCT domain-containing protein n=1 Tax=Coptis chinensis TaxID=261450 RepID=A0A835M835_9MAGN|nr:hypothetical protein IFM89_015626 [Coptis chinensis]
MTQSVAKAFMFPVQSWYPSRLDTENFVMLCPLHPSSKLPKELCESQRKRRKQCLTIAEKVYRNALCCVTHIIASTDENGACRRTLKFLSGILEGKWILKIDWVNACMKAMEPVAEEAYEIILDIHAIKDGPQRGRLSVLNKQPELFYVCNFHFMGEFVGSYKGYLQDLVVAVEGIVLQRKPILGDRCGLPSASTTCIIYSAELSDQCDSGKKALCNRRQDEAKTLASSTGAKVAGHSWVLRLELFLVVTRVGVLVNFYLLMQKVIKLPTGDLSTLKS